MGCWGTGTFDNDHAADWVWTLEESEGLGAVAEALLSAPGDTDFEADEASESLAAAEVVAALLGKPSAELPVEVARWVAAHRGLDARPYREAALNHARATLEPNSELRELWAENYADFPFWKATVEALIARLTSAE